MAFPAHTTRRARSPADRRTEFLAVHVTPAEAAAIRAAADEADRSVSTEIRRAILKHLNAEVAAT